MFLFNNNHNGRLRLALCAALTIVSGLMWTAHRAQACGGFFCQAVPINQAAEQIIFRKDGDDTTAVVMIQYTGEAPDFSWVVPVPGVPELSTGSDFFFQQFEPLTRPQFTLEIEGSPCEVPNLAFIGAPGSATSDTVAEDADDGVEVLDSGVVGPFETLVISSDDPQAMADWLEENDYDIGERGAELIAPYVEEGMNFVALKLTQDAGVGDIRPLIMEYSSRNAMIPIRLTAVAAQQDMGVVVWILGDGRAVPLNYLHVIPNYTLLNWYSGTLAAYASYQGLITNAMDEAGGQGFATDYAGSLEPFMDQLPDPEVFSAAISDLEAADSVSAFYESLIFSFVFPSTQLTEILRRQLPLGVGVEEFVYFDPSLLIAAVTEDSAEAARQPIIDELRSGILEPLEATLSVFDGDPFMTRMYTTLSADEMTVDPEFSFNKDMEGQELERQALLTLNCDVLTGSQWTLQLVSGTDRDGEIVLEGTGTQPFTTPLIDQPNIARAEITSTDRAPQVTIDNSDLLGSVMIAGESSGGLCGAGAACGTSGVSLLLFTMLGMGALKSARRRRTRRG